MPFDGQNFVKPNPVLETLIKADAYLTPETWCKHRYESDDGRVCMVGALTKAGPGFSMAALRALRRALPGDVAASGFNDRPETTFADVKAVFARAIELASKP